MPGGKKPETVEQQRRYLNSVLQTTPDGFWSINPGRHVRDVNEAYCQMTATLVKNFYT
jgi:PAS domain-containing protein